MKQRAKYVVKKQYARRDCFWLSAYAQSAALWGRRPAQRQRNLETVLPGRKQIFA
ncbi:hypothetical protein [Sphingomonas faeni]|uniref:hypothetical protein n=1 Tax=Sphingomonas faeni TaxID=185950 RepID=UPI00335A2AC2